MLKKLSLKLSSKTKAQEILLLMHDAKPVVRQGFYDYELPKIQKLCDENKLFLVKSTFKVLLADEGTYSNKGIRIPESDKRLGMYFVYISKDEEKAWMAAYNEMMRNERDLGLALGYPSCCVEFFCRSFKANNPNPQHKPTNPYTNLTQREKDCVLIFHFPCSSDCQKSLQLARQNYQIIHSVDKVRAKEMMDLLSKGVLVNL